MFESDIKKTPDEVAKEKMEQITSSKETPEETEARHKADADIKAAEKKNEEPGKASTESQTGKKKTPDEMSEAERLEAQAVKDEQLLNATDEEADKLSEDDKKARTELQSKAKKSKVQERIDQLVREREEAKEASVVDRKAVEDLEKRIKDLENPPKKEDFFVTVEKERIVKYIEEDSSKPLAERREMSKEELNEWAIEDNLAATAWITQRTIRRSDEKKEDKSKEQTRKIVDEIIETQKPSIEKTLKAHPELDTKARELELEGQGKSKQEIFDTLCSENKKYKIVQEVLSKNKHFYSLPNGPELAVAEMEKIMGKSSNSNSETQAEHDARITKDALDREAERQAEIDAASSEGSSHSKTGKKKVEKSELELAQEAIVKRSGLTQEQVKARLQHRKENGIR